MRAVQLTAIRFSSATCLLLEALRLPVTWIPRNEPRMGLKESLLTTRFFGRTGLTSVAPFARIAALVQVLAQHRVEARLGVRLRVARRPLRHQDQIRLRPPSMAEPRLPVRSAVRPSSRPTFRSATMLKRPFARAEKRRSSVIQTKRLGRALQILEV